jgi:ribosomal 50S subunit-associated protein YjgA (DUF615 family)
MFNPLPHVRRVYHLIRDTAAHRLHRLLDRLRAAWQRHLTLMDDRESYRAQIVAGVAALVAVFELDPRAGALLVAALGLHAAAYGHGPRPPRPRAVFGTDEGDEGWDPFR